MGCLAVVLGGCPSGKPPHPGSDSGAGPSVASAPASAPPAASSGALGAASAVPGIGAAYVGAYTLVPGAIYISTAKDFANVKQAKDDATMHVGEGSLTLRVGPDGRVSGTIDKGPAAPAIIDGSKIGDQINGTVRRKSTSDDGLTGTLIATAAADHVEGTLVLAESKASIVREGKFSLKKN